MSTPSATLRASLPTQFDLGGDRIATIRPLQATDAAADRRFLEALSPESRRERFLCTVNAVDDRLLQLLTAEDADGPLAVVATLPGAAGSDIIGVARLAPADEVSAECAITVADAWQHRGLGHALFDALKVLARQRRVRRLFSIDAASNARMRAFARSVGARVRADPADRTQVVYELELD